MQTFFSFPFYLLLICILVWPQWWSFADVSQHTVWWTENYYKKKVHLKSFQNPFLLCPGSAQLAIRTWSVLGTTITKFHFRFLLHRINSCFCILVPFFTNYCWLNMTKTAWNWKIWWNSKPEGQSDPDWTPIWTPGAWPNPKFWDIFKILAWTL